MDFDWVLTSDLCLKVVDGTHDSPKEVSAGKKLEFDAGSMHAGDSIKVKDLDIAKDQEVELITDPEATVAVVSELKNAAAEEQEEGTEQ